ncbi:MAG TPA: hypothetical protein VNQ76_04260 [Planctomicrobium sp.]|nr:hypothetical protein [Planctomicrobium sp.]
MKRAIEFHFICLLGMSMLWGSGCTSSTPATETKQTPSRNRAADHAHEHPTTYADAVAQLESLIRNINAAAAANEEEKLHDLIHDAQHLLSDVSSLAAKENLDEKQQASLRQAIQSIQADFGVVEEKLHGGEGKTFSEVAEKIETAIKTLKKGVASSKEKSGTPNQK